MQVLSCAPAQVRDSFSHYEGGISPRHWILSYTGRSTKKLMGNRVPWPTVGFGSSPGKFSKGRSQEKTQLNGWSFSCFAAHLVEQGLF
jgi:hypothetical protein